MMRARSTQPQPSSEATLRALELPSFLAVVAQLGSTDLGRERIRNLIPHGSEASLLEHRRRFEEASRLLGGGALVPSFEEPIRPVLSRLGTGHHGSSGADLVFLLSMLRAVRQARQRIESAEPACPALTAVLEDVPSLEDLERRISRSLDPRGEVRPDASPRLVELRQRIHRLRDVLYRELRDYVQENRDSLSEETVPLRGGRLVLTLQSGARGKLAGLTHGRSGSGRSFYFEPLAVVEDNNRLQQSTEDEDAERQRILAELLAAAQEARPALDRNASFLAELDLLQAAVRLGELTAGRMVEICAGDRLRIVSGRHPLLEPSLARYREEALGQAGHEGVVVPLEVELSPERRILVVTGPNAGGKTVALKTTGLLVLANLCGLPVPAGKGSRLPMASHVVATVGDDQDLLADRSTFSGRLLRLREVWETASAGSLVLIDELGSGTEPEEGSALAISLLEVLLDRSSLGVITSHLLPIATAALELPGASCAAMAFDAATGRPTFRLVPGPPGGSEALALARRLKLPAAWLDRAEELLGEEHRDLRRLLSEVEELRRELAERRESLDAELGDAKLLRQRIQEEEAALREERKALAAKLRRELEEFRLATTRKLREEVEKLRSSVSQGRRRGLEGEAVQRLFEEAPSFSGEEEDGSAEGPLVVGGPVRHRTLAWVGTLEKLDGDRAEVHSSGKRLRCRAEELVPASARELPGAPRRAKRVGSGNDLSLAVSAPEELNLIGMRVEPALGELDTFLDQALLASRQQVRVIHGHGSGRLRQAVREFLRSHRAVASFRPGGEREGGDGATVALLGVK
ncbi:MAG: Smr/MutS family protein [Acidobacteria bacterium]|nr:Smr/MutS family protein [Acidobacteriota bacterium]